MEVMERRLCVRACVMVEGEVSSKIIESKII